MDVTVLFVIQKAIALGRPLVEPLLSRHGAILGPPLPSEKIQLEKMLADEKRFSVQQEESRRQKLEDYQQRLKQSEYDDELRKWPLSISANTIRARMTNASEDALLVLLKSTSLISPLTTKEYLSNALHALELASFMVNDFVLGVHASAQQVKTAENDIILIADHKASSQLNNQTLVAALSQPLKSIPSLLLEVIILDDFRYRLSVSHWGCALNSRDKVFTAVSNEIDFSSFSVNPKDLASAIASTAATLIVCVYEAYSILRDMRGYSRPVFTNLLALPTVNVNSDSYWQIMATAYRSAIDQVAVDFPILAAELAAQASVVAHEAKIATYASVMLDCAIDILIDKSYSNDVNPIEHGAINSSAFRRKAPRKVLDALKLIRPEYIVSEDYESKLSCFFRRNIDP